MNFMNYRTWRPFELSAGVHDVEYDAVCPAVSLIETIQVKIVNPDNDPDGICDCDE